ncbi:MAG: hypothetical protein ACXWWD_07535 [Chitinophagaceae bacterium]
MKKNILMILVFCSYLAKAQELYVYTEPASNMPARSVSAKLTANYIGRQATESRFMQRYTPELMFGINKKWMVHVGSTFADMHTKKFRWESVYLYGKYRFLSNDELHSHFRLAAFADIAYTRSPFHFDEVSLQGDKSGVQLGLIATQLWNKLAVSGTVSHTQVLHKSRDSKTDIYIPSRIYQVMNYSLSAGYLVLPFQYTDYKQTNLNIYTEVLAQQSLDRKAYFVDLAPAVQLIFNSNAKLNLGYRFQLNGDMLRMSENSWLISFERTFLNALRKKK